MTEKEIKKEINESVKLIGNNKVTKKLIERAYNNAFNIGVCRVIANIITYYELYLEDPFVTKKNIIDGVYGIVNRGCL